MKNIEIGSYIAEIQAKTIYDNSNTEEITGYLLNELSLVYTYAAKYMEIKGRNHIASDYHDKGESLYQLLTNSGFYEEMKNH